MVTIYDISGCGSDIPAPAARGACSVTHKYFTLLVWIGQVQWRVLVTNSIVTQGADALRLLQVPCVYWT